MQQNPSELKIISLHILIQFHILCSETVFPYSLQNMFLSTRKETAQVQNREAYCKCEVGCDAQRPCVCEGQARSWCVGTVRPQLEPRCVLPDLSPSCCVAVHRLFMASAPQPRGGAQSVRHLCMGAEDQR